MRQIIGIDESTCDGCGLCATACAEGAIAIIHGKGRLINQTSCDGLGARLAECPQGAITMEEREAPPFDEEAVVEAKGAHRHEEPLPCGCPGSHAQTVSPCGCAEDSAQRAEHRPSRLRNWPVQVRLVPVCAPSLRGADLVTAADSVPFAFASFPSGSCRGGFFWSAAPSSITRGTTGRNWPRSSVTSRSDPSRSCTWNFSAAAGWCASWWAPWPMRESPSRCGSPESASATPSRSHGKWRLPGPPQRYPQAPEDRGSRP